MIYNEGWLERINNIEINLNTLLENKLSASYTEDLVEQNLIDEPFVVNGILTTHPKRSSFRKNASTSGRALSVNGSFI
jgi:hypothetical protein